MINASGLFRSDYRKRQENSDGTTADANMYYTTPTDGTTYNGSYTVTSYDGRTTSSRGPRAP